jgi:hypothetical protein
MLFQFIDAAVRPLGMSPICPFDTFQALFGKNPATSTLFGIGFMRCGINKYGKHGVRHCRFVDPIRIKINSVLWIFIIASLAFGAAFV